MTHYRSKPVSNPATNSRRPPPTPVPLIVNSHSGAGGAHTPGSVQGACKPASAPASPGAPLPAPGCVGAPPQPKRRAVMVVLAVRKIVAWELRPRLPNYFAIMAGVRGGC